MKKIKLIIPIFILILMILGALFVFIKKPLFIREFKDVLINKKNSIIVKTSKNYSNLKKADHSKKYFKNEKNINIPILLYHNITLEKSDRANYYMCTTAEKFEYELSELKNLGYTFISFDDLIKYNNNELALPEYVAIISLDDGYLDNYENAFPIIKKLNVPINIFVIDNCVGSNKYFSWDQAREMDKSGLVNIYTHGKTHIPYGDESAEIVEEYISFAHKHLEEELRTPCF